MFRDYLKSTLWVGLKEKPLTSSAPVFGPVNVATRHAQRRRICLSLVGAALLTLFTLTALKFVINECCRKGGDSHDPSIRLSEASSRKLLIDTLQPVPIECKADSELLSIEECWIEHAGSLRYFCAWVPYYEKSGKYHLCFRLRSGDHLFGAGESGWFLVCDKPSGKEFLGTVALSTGERVYFVDLGTPLEVPKVSVSLRQGGSPDPVCVFHFHSSNIKDDAD